MEWLMTDILTEPTGDTIELGLIRVLFSSGLAADIGPDGLVRIPDSKGNNQLVKDLSGLVGNLAAGIGGEVGYEMQKSRLFPGTVYGRFVVITRAEKG